MMNGVYDFDLIGDIQDVFAKGRDVGQIKAAMDAAALDYEHPEQLVASLDNYEDPTFLSLVTGGAPTRKIYLASAFLLTINRVPFIYSGNEYGVDYRAPGELFSPQRDPRYLARFKQLVSIRSREGAFRSGTLAWLDGSDTILSYDRALGGRHFFVALNNSARRQPIRLSLGSRGIHCAGVENLLLPNDPHIRLVEPGTAREALVGVMRPWEPKIVRCLR
jgi:glycosidase